MIPVDPGSPGEYPSLGADEEEEEEALISNRSLSGEAGGAG